MNFLIVFVLATVLANTAPAVEARGRIYNANNVKPGQFPSLVRLQSNLRQNFGNYYRIYASSCSGTLIRYNWVLTAGHCVFINDQKPTSITIYLGSEKRGAPYESNVTVNSIDKNVLVHKDYVHGRTNDDIALIRTPRIQTTKLIGVAQLPQQRDFVNAKVNVAGWGVLTDSGIQGAYAQWSDFTVYANEKCPTNFGKLLPSQICLYKRYVSACPGDSGGPTYYDKQVIGVSSFIAGTGCESNQAMVVTNVVYYMNWILENIR